MKKLIQSVTIIVYTAFDRFRQRHSDGKLVSFRVYYWVRSNMQSKKTMQLHQVVNRNQRSFVILSILASAGHFNRDWRHRC